MIVYRAVMDEVVHEGEQFCSDCSPHTLRYALIEAARKGDRNFLICLDCEARWTPDPADIAKAIRDWLLVFVPESPQLGAVYAPVRDDESRSAKPMERRARNPEADPRRAATMMTVVTKRCDSCKQMKALILFGRRRSELDGRRGVCRRCERARRAKPAAPRPPAPDHPSR